MEAIKGVDKKIKEKFSDIIFETKYRNPNYEEIHFDLLLERIFPRMELFHTNFNIKSEIDNKLKELYGDRFDKHKIFKHSNQPIKVLFQKLKYYQKSVGINGSNTCMDIPVLVVRYRNETTLYDGYHRVLQRIMNDELEIDAYVLAV